MTVEQLQFQTLDVPKILGYDPVRCLARGSQGHVWLMMRCGSKELVAAKCYRTCGTENSEQGVIARHRGSSFTRHNQSPLTQEWRVLANYNHEHLLAFRGIVELEGQWAGGRALLVEYAPGGSLHALIVARGPLSIGETVTAITPLAQVLAYLEDQGIVHGDVSPSNLLFTAHGKPLLADLGFATLLGEGTQASGTTGFCAPEGPKSAAGDVFSLAAVAWFALTGVVPPPTKERMSLSFFVENVPTSLAAAIEAGLETTPERRPTASAFAQAVFRSAKAAPLELAEAVHHSVVSELLTQRELAKESKLTTALGQLIRRFRSPAGILQEKSVSTPRGRALRRESSRQIRLAWLAAGLAVSVAAGAVVLSVAEANEPKTVQARTPNTLVADASSSITGLMKSLPAEVRRGLLSDNCTEALSSLAWVRSHALASGRLELLELVNAAGSRAHKADASLTAQLKSSGTKFSGLDTKISNAAVPNKSTNNATVSDTAQAATATVWATVTTSPYTEQDSKGQTVNGQTTAQIQELSFVLSNHNGRWLIQEVLPK